VWPCAMSVSVCTSAFSTITISMPRAVLGSKLSCSSSRSRIHSHHTSTLLTFITCQTPSALDGSMHRGGLFVLHQKPPKSRRVTPVPGPSIRAGPTSTTKQRKSEGISSMLIKKKWWLSFPPLFFFIFNVFPLYQPFVSLHSR
jgi:hypothetical protein